MSGVMENQIESPNDKNTVEFPETLNINPTINKAEKEEFINRVMFDISTSDTNHVFFEMEESFISNFLDMFTDFPIPFEEVNDIALNMKLKSAVLLYPFAQSLINCIEKQITYKSASNEAIETVSCLANRTLDAANKVCDILDNIQDLTKDGKFLKVIPKKKLDLILEWIQKIANTVAGSMNQDSELFKKTVEVNRNEDE